MKVSDIDVTGSDPLYTIILWGFGGLKVLIDGLYDKAGEVENNDLANRLHFCASLLDSHTEAVKLKLEELNEKHIQPLEEKYRKEVTA